MSDKIINAKMSTAYFSTNAHCINRYVSKKKKRYIIDKCYFGKLVPLWHYSPLGCQIKLNQVVFGGDSTWMGYWLEFVAFRELTLVLFSVVAQVMCVMLRKDISLNSKPYLQTRIHIVEE